ncbi:PREDICTED: AP-5 complex subunit mu-like [Nelumbo nucifera]|uniref:AP-5 complex subunit mu-like n=1 Tax=Nelumbo nucifera TaxID=4432 RepID=A0A1U7ZDH2_NELNU|nr:PREDICTED: AP-5 complex subunit mu-like [Nelumbo nucifera]
MLHDMKELCTRAFMVGHAIGDVITGDLMEPDIVISAAPSVGGLLDSLTGSIGISSISARAKPVAAPVVASTTSGAVVTGTATLDAPKIGSRPFDKDALRTFISSSLPFGTPLDLNYSNISAIKVNGFSSSDLPPADLRQPAWKPYLYKGKQRILFTIHETVYAALYDRDEIPDVLSISGQVNCRAELEGLPDVSFPLTGLNNAHLEVLSFHPCAQVPEQGVDKQGVIWKIVASGRGVSGKSIEATFPGTIKFAPRSTQRLPSMLRSTQGHTSEDDSDIEPENSNNMVNVDEYLMKKMNKDLPSVDLEEPFCWQAYNYAKVSFRIVGATLSGMTIDPKTVSIYPAVKAPVEFSTLVSSGDYIFWNTLGRCPFAASPTVQRKDRK